jgi:hypothetical protein
MTLPRPPGLAGIKSWIIRVLNSRFNKLDRGSQPAIQSVATQTSRPFSTATARSRVQRTYNALVPRVSQSRSFTQFTFPRNARKTSRIKIHPTTFFLRPPVLGTWFRVGGRAFHTSPTTNALLIQQIAHGVSKSLNLGLHPRSTNFVPGTVLAEISSRARDALAGYIRFSLSPPTWIPSRAGVQDPDLLSAVTSQLRDLERVVGAITKLRSYGDFPTRVLVAEDTREVSLDVLFPGATTEDVARWNREEFKLGTGRVGQDEGGWRTRGYEENVEWSEVLDVERRDQREGIMLFWEELKGLEGRIR